MYIIIKERVDVYQDGPGLIIEAPPPSTITPPPAPQIANDIHVFT